MTVCIIPARKNSKRIKNKNIENLAGFRGMSCGVKYAEAFFVERIID